MIKTICQKFLKYYLKLLAKLVLVIYRPVVVVVAGSLNKQFFKEQIKERLALAGFSVYANSKNFNTEIGLPLAILDLPSGYDSYKKWVPIIWRAPAAVFKKRPPVMVLELGISERGNMKFLLSLVSPRIAVVCDLTQRYLEGFADLYELIDEYEYLISRVNKDGLVVLNYDNLKVRQLAEKAKAEVIFFSLAALSDKKASGKNENIWRAGSVAKDVDGQTIEVWHNSDRREFKINRFGQHHLQAFLGGLIIEEKISKIKQ